MGLADLLKNNFRLKRLYTNENTPQIQGLQMNEDGSVRQVDIPSEIKPSLTSRVADLVLGKRVQTADTIDSPLFDTDGNATINTTINSAPRTGGWLRDIAQGYRENRDTPISIDNFATDTKKNWATRLGEGLGTMARFADSPLGRSALVGAAVGLTGGNGLQALTYGAMTGAGNQRNRMADKLYRDDLIKTQQQMLRNSNDFTTLTDAEKAQVLQDVQANNANYSTLSESEQNKLNQEALDRYLLDRQNRQLDAIANDVNSYKGYLSADDYSNIAKAQQIRSDADWRKTYFETDQKNLEAQRDWQRLQYEMQRADKAADRAANRYENALDRELKYYTANLEHEDRQNENSDNTNKTTGDEQILGLADLYIKLPQMKVGTGAKKLASLITAAKYASGFGGQEATAYDAVADAMATSLARRNGEKGNLSDRDIDRWRKSIPSLTDTPEQAQAKFDALHRVYGYPQINILSRRNISPDSGRAF